MIFFFLEVMSPRDLCSGEVHAKGENEKNLDRNEDNFFLIPHKI